MPHSAVSMRLTLGQMTSTATAALLKSGTGKLILTGNNTYSGGTTIVGGTLATNSETALGRGDVSIEKEGILEVNQNLVIQGKFDTKRRNPSSECKFQKFNSNCS
jgi:autotransporter-associated beta strand protein